VALFPEDRQAPELAHEVVHVRLSELQVKRPRQWGACWLSGELWQQLQRDDFWRERLGVSREGTDWLDVLKTLVSYRLISPGSEWRLHREWYLHSAMADLLGRSGEAMELQSLYRCQDKLLAHKTALFSFLRERWQDLFHAEFEVLLLTLLLLPGMAHANNVAVNCPGASLNAAVAALPPNGPNTITVTGTCNEDVMLTNERSLTIIAAAGGAKIVQPQDSNTFDIALSQNITLQNLEIPEIPGVPGSMPGTGGGGVSVGEASDVHIMGCDIHDNEGGGVL